MNKIQQEWHLIMPDVSDRANMRVCECGRIDWSIYQTRKNICLLQCSCGRKCSGKSKEEMIEQWNKNQYVYR